jgi:ATP-dependent helicase/nuclease subunit A
VRELAERASDAQIGQALDALILKRDQLRRWTLASGEAGGKGEIDDALLDLRRRLKLAEDETENSVCREICSAAGWSREECARLGSSVGGGTSAVRAVLLAIARAEDLSTEANARLALFLTTDSNGWKARNAGNRLGAALTRIQPELRQRFEGEAERLLGLIGRLDLVRAYAATEALLLVGDAILGAYHAAKRRAGALDFQDLIARTRDLLSRREWVLYKLDARIEHILVDEAQDTSPDQWAVIETIAEDFFSGEGASGKPRTIFAVGDDKQSIFGFQGAAPWKLAEMRAFFKEKAEQAEKVFVARPLFLSFRSTREVLNAVDIVFTHDLAARITGSTYEAHASHRDHLPGRVVILPRVVREKREEPDDWTAPYDAPSAAESELSQKIAGEIARLRGTVLPSGKRLKDGEILVLVRRRDALFAALNRALRARRIPTAGADRVPIATHIAVLDLFALADVMLLPDDDLQLAALLKSPLLGIDEEALMRLAATRDRSLWRTLRDADDLVLRSAAETLRRWRRMADQVTPFRFFATVLGPDGGRHAFRARLGSEADDVLDAFLSQALAFENTGAPSLQGFLRYLRANESDLKREAEEGAAGVRVMTVHGAKGLEADVVFLVDTGGWIVVPNQRETLVPIGSRDDPAFLWRRLKDEAPAVQRRADQAEDRRTEDEYLRLLYVAMTRARDVLYVAGIRGERTPEGCWYSLVANALVPQHVERHDKELVAPFVWPVEQRPPIAPGKEAGAAAGDAVEGPRWLTEPAPSPPPAPEPLRPSNALAEPDPVPGVAIAADGALPGDVARLRGNLVHRLLEILPRVPADDRSRVAGRLLAGESSADPVLRESIIREAVAVLSEPSLAKIFGEGSRAEVAIVGELSTEKGRYAVSGRIDRILRDTEGWHLVDFKTDRNVPAAAENADPAYVLQMALYRRLLMGMEPGAEVSATLVFSGGEAGPKVIPIPAAMMEQALADLGIPANPLP